MSTSARTPEHTAKMGMGQINRALDHASEEEKAAILRQLTEKYGLQPVFPDAAGPPEEVAEDAPPVVRENSPVHTTADGVQYVNHDEIRHRMEARKATLQDQINRSVNERQIMSWSAEIKSIDWAIERSFEADKIPVAPVRYGNDGLAKGLVIHTCDMLDSPNPLIKFSLFRFETDRPFRIACLRWYEKNRKKGDTPIFEIPLGHEAYCGMDGQFQGFLPAETVADLVNKGRAKRPHA